MGALGSSKVPPFPWPTWPPLYTRDEVRTSALFTRVLSYAVASSSAWLSGESSAGSCPLTQAYLRRNALG